MDLVCTTYYNAIYSTCTLPKGEKRTFCVLWCIYASILGSEARRQKSVIAPRVWLGEFAWYLGNRQKNTTYDRIHRRGRNRRSKVENATCLSSKGADLRRMVGCVSSANSFKEKSKKVLPWRSFFPCSFWLSYAAFFIFMFLVSRILLCDRMEGFSGTIWDRCGWGGARNVKKREGVCIGGWDRLFSRVGNRHFVKCCGEVAAKVFSKAGGITCCIERGGGTVWVYRRMSERWVPFRGAGRKRIRGRKLSN